MRSNKELLQILLDSIDSMNYGLCGLVFDLYLVNKLSSVERIRLSRYIKSYAPPRYNVLGDLCKYNWPVCEKGPRAEWLKAEIKKLESYEK